MSSFALRLGGPGYPPPLARIPGPPPALYVKGDPRALLGPCVAVVGTRGASAAGRRAAFAIGERLAGLGVCVVSGLALGIDGEAHGGALVAGGCTVAVLAHGLDRPAYPPAHAPLAGDIVAGGGALVSEYPDGTPVAGWRFVKRDRIQAALGLAVVLVESGERGGSFHALKAAKALGRPIFAVSSAGAGFKREGMCRAIDEFGARRVHSMAQLALGALQIVERWRAESREGTGQ
jgi:DNA processing protein